RTPAFAEGPVQSEQRAPHRVHAALQSPAADPQPAMGQQSPGDGECVHPLRRPRRLWMVDGGVAWPEMVAGAVVAAGRRISAAVRLGKHGVGISITILLHADCGTVDDLVAGNG